MIGRFQPVSHHILNKFVADGEYLTEMGSVLILLVVECPVYGHTSVTRPPPQQQDPCVPVSRSSGSICSGLVPVMISPSAADQ